MLRRLKPSVQIWIFLPTTKAVGSGIFAIFDYQCRRRMLEGILSHIVFTVKNSRYDWQRIKRKKPVGFIGFTYPFFEKEEEEYIIRLLCDVAGELGLRLAAFNFCGDHVHAVLITDTSEISSLIGIWKGKSASLYNHRNQPFKNNSQQKDITIINQTLWAKSFYKKRITSANELENVIIYVANNRKKHGLMPLTSSSTKIISTLVLNKIL